MALRVLLADESTTIKKVMQLALQDFAVEVKSIQSGVDVVEVAKTFLPDIIFVDVLLQKKNGYDVCVDIKKESTLRAIPLVLMWSSFMDLDERLAQNSGCDRRLEKPFDVENLRQVILELIPKTRSQRLAHFLNFPKNLTEPLKEEETNRSRDSRPHPDAPPASPLPQDDHQSNWNMGSFDEINTPGLTAVPDLESEKDDEEGFKEVRITPPPKATATSAPDGGATKKGNLSPEDRDPWSHQDLSRFKLEFPPSEDDEIQNQFQNQNEEPIDAQSSEMREFLLRLENTSAAAPVIPASPQQPKAEQRQTKQKNILEPTHTPEISEFEIDESMPSNLGLEFDDKDQAYRANPSNEAGHLANSDIGTHGGPIPQIDPDRLEQIIRAQSREIIEAVVRRIVPDLAIDLIRQELHRLIDDSGGDGGGGGGGGGNTGGSRRNPSIEKGTQ